MLERLRLLSVSGDLGLYQRMLSSTTGSPGIDLNLCQNNSISKISLSHIYSLVATSQMYNFSSNSFLNIITCLPNLSNSNFLTVDNFPLWGTINLENAQYGETSWEKLLGKHAYRNRSRENVSKKVTSSVRNVFS